MSDLRKASKYAVQRKRHSIWRNVVTGIAAVVVFCTTYALILPAITMESEPTYCGFEDHEHIEECYELVCGVEEFVPHYHTDECYTNAEGNIDRDNGPFCHKEETTVHVHSDDCKVVLTCELEEYDPHPQHTDECYGLHPVLICEEQEAAAHAHDENCYVQGYTCGLAESEGHTHGSECCDESGELVCAVEESDGHTHSDACLGQVLSCGLEETDGHTHDDTCYEEQNGLICTSLVGEGHTHDSDCYETHDTFQCGHPEGKVVHQHNTNCYRLICEEHVHTEECYVKPEDAPAPKAQLRAAPANDPTVRDLLLEVFSEEELQEICDTYPEYTLEDIWALLNTPMTLDDDNAPVNLAELSQNNKGSILVTAEKKEGSYFVPATSFADGDTIKVSIGFTLNDGVVKKGQSVTYQLPAGVKVSGDNNRGNVTSSRGNIGTYSISASGLVTITFNDSFLESATAIEGTFFFQGSASVNGGNGDQNYNFPGSSTNITVTPPTVTPVGKDHNTRKTGSANADGTVSYTIQIRTNKGSDTLNVADYLGNADFNSSSVSVVKKNTSDGTVKSQHNPTVQIGPDPNNSSQQEMKIEGLDPLTDSTEYYEITYTVTPRGNAAADGSVVVNNNVFVNGGGSDNPNQYITAVKAKIGKDGSYDGARDVFHWTITVNEGGNNISGWNLKDELPSGLSFKGNVVITGADGTTLPVDSSCINGNTLNYTFPNNAKSQKYTVTFDSTAPQANSGNVTNKAELTGDGKTYTAEKPVGYSRRTRDLSKERTSTVEQSGSVANHTWKSTLKLEPNVFKDMGELVYKDYILTPTTPAGAEHYGTATAIMDSIGRTLNAEINDSDGTRWRYFGGNSDALGTWDIKCFTAVGGTEVPYTDNETPVTYFEVHLTPSANVPGDTAVLNIRFEYPTISKYANLGQGETVTFVNKGQFGDIEKEAKWDYTKPVKLQKGLILKEWGNDVFSPADYKLEYTGNGQSVRYRLVINTEKTDNEKIELTDVLPAGVAFDGIESFMRLKQGGAWGDLEWNADGTYYNFNLNASHSPTAVAEPQDDGTTKVTFTIPAGYNTQSGYDNGITLALSYAVKLTEAVWPDSVKETVFLKNTVAGFGGDDHTIELHRTPERLRKTVRQETSTDDFGNTVYENKLDYTIIINPGAEDLNQYDEYITLEDRLSTTIVQSATLLTADAVLYQYAGMGENGEPILGDPINPLLYSLSTDNTNPRQPKFTLTLPDETPLVLKYTYSFNVGNAAEAPRVSNEVELMGYTASLNDTKIELNSSGATADSAILDIHKVDIDNDKSLLNGAEFELWSWENGTWNQYGTSNLVTGSKHSGLLRFQPEGNQGSSNDADAFIKRNVVYKLVEKKAPAGYGMPADPNTYFVWEGGDHPTHVVPDGVSADSIKVISRSDAAIISIPNKSTSIQVHKVWQDSSGRTVDPPAGTEVEVQLSRRTRETITYKVSLCAKGSLNGDGSFNAWAEVVDYYVPKNGTLKVTLSPHNNVAVLLDGEKVLDKVGGADKVVYELTNVQSNHVVNIATTSNCESVYVSNPTVFEYGDAEVIPETRILKAANNWSSMWENLDAADADGKPYYYTVTELNAPEGWAVSYGATNGRIQTGDITVVNTKPTETQTQIVVKKVWLDPEGNESSPAVDEIEFILWQKASDQDAPRKYGTYTINSSLNWQKTIYRLPLMDFTESGAPIREYTYSVQETTTGKFVTEYDGNGVASGNIAIKNIKPESNFIKISVDKQWFRGEDPTDAPIDEVAFRIIRKAGEDGSPEEVYRGTLNSTNGWKDSKSDLPMFTDNTFTTAYSYDVEELTTSESARVAFESKVIKDGYNFTIKNTLPEIPKTGLVVQKAWDKDDSGNVESVEFKLFRREWNQDHAPTADELSSSNLTRESFDSVNAYEVDGETVFVLADENQWKYTFDNLPASNDDGTMFYSYYVVENTDAAYQIISNGSEVVPADVAPVINVTNRVTTSISVEKTWWSENLRLSGETLPNDPVHFKLFSQKAIEAPASVAMVETDINFRGPKDGNYDPDHIWSADNSGFHWVNWGTQIHDNNQWNTYALPAGTTITITLKRNPGTASWNIDNAGGGSPERAQDGAYWKLTFVIPQNCTGKYGILIADAGLTESDIVAIAIDPPNYTVPNGATEIRPGNTSAEYPYTVSRNNNEWKMTFDGLPKYDDNGDELVYFVVEQPVSGYKTVYSNYSGVDGGGEIKVQNVKIPYIPVSVTLPETGGIGLSLFMMAGGGLTGGAAVGLAVQKYKPKRKRGRFER